ncbi:hypothetical protein [Erythrobacter aureus]|uniref:hypothetical protein n=1 Tax=Erythrobacter aureus TaxID=2182384 RepID=UPI0013B44321|nr:hypothetical protein [Erythrobacter aureus]
MTTYRAGYRCGGCETPFHKETPTHCTVEVYYAFAKSLRCPHCGSDKISIGLGLTDEENKALIADGHWRTRAENWKYRGEVGLSAKTIYNHFMGHAGAKPSVPQDPSDLRRCLLLLEHVPEWKPRMDEMRTVSAQWALLIDRWDDLLKTYAEELADGTGKAPRTYAILQQAASYRAPAEAS